MNRFQIVLARICSDVEATDEWTRARGDGVNPVPKLRTVQKPVAVMWLRDASESEIPRAEAFASTEGWTVVRVLSDERDPLAYAKKLVKTGQNLGG